MVLSRSVPSADWWVYGGIILSMALTTAIMVYAVLAARRDEENR